MGLMQEAISNTIGKTGGEMLGIATGAATAVYPLFKGIVRVQTGERGVRVHLSRTHREKDAWLLRREAQMRRMMRMSEAEVKPDGWRSRHSQGAEYGYVGPGFHFVFPFTHGIVKQSVLDRQTPLGAFDVELNEGQYTVRSSIIWHVSPDGDNPFYSLFRSQNQENLTGIVADLCFSGLGEVIAARKNLASIEPFQVENDLRDARQENLAYYGVELNKLNLQPLVRSMGEMYRYAGTATMQKVVQQPNGTVNSLPTPVFAVLADQPCSPIIQSAAS